MLDVRNLLIDPSNYSNPDPRSHQAAMYKQALNLFGAARSRAAIHKIRNALLRRTARLFNLASIPAYQIRSQHYGGVRAVAIDQICGSLGRTEDFDSAFHPLDDRVRDRWVAVAMVRFEGLPLDSVQLIRVGCCYFVQDGHHRISVARALGQVTIDAEITIWEVAGRMPWDKPEDQPSAKLMSECAVSQP